MRELSKRESQHKIMTAARRAFAEQGYDGATLRDIAASAGLTVGALFNHVTDKRDLIYLIFNEEVRTITGKALGSPRPYQDLCSKILSITEHYFRLFSSEPVLSRILLSEVVMETPGPNLAEYVTTREYLIKGIEDVIAAAQASGEILTAETPERLARHTFFTFAASLRWWLASADHPPWRSGHKEYERLLRLQIEGFRPADATTTARAGSAKSGEGEL